MQEVKKQGRQQSRKSSIKQEMHICSFCATFYNQSPGKSKTSSSIWSMTIDFYFIVSTFFALRDSRIQNIYGWLYSKCWNKPFPAPFVLQCPKMQSLWNFRMHLKKYKMWYNHVKLWGGKSSSHAAIISKSIQWFVNLTLKLIISPWSCWWWSVQLFLNSRSKGRHFPLKAGKMLM